MAQKEALTTARLVAAVFSALFPAPGAEAAGPPYIVIDLGTLRADGVSGSSIAAAINNAGQVTGYSDTDTAGSRAFLYAGGVMKDLGTLRSGKSVGFGINNFGRVAGASDLTPGFPHPFLYAGGPLQDLGALPGSNPGYGEGFAINDAGQVTGYSTYDYSTHSGIHAFVTVNGNMVDLGSFESTNSLAFSFGNAINASGVVTGRSQIAGLAPYHAFLSSGGPMTDLGTLGGNESSGLGINDPGDVTGWAQIADGNKHAFLRLNSGGPMVDLRTLPGHTFSQGNDINNLGQVVGTSGVGYAQRAFLYSGGTMYDLNDLVTNSPPGLGVLIEARGINDLGWIVGHAGYGPYVHAFLAMPTGPWAERTVVRNLPKVAGSAVEVGVFTFAGSAGSMEIALNVSEGAAQWSVAKRYIVPVRSNLTGISPANTWFKVLPTHDSGAFNGNNCELEMKVSGATALAVRVRTTAYKAGTPVATLAIKTFGLQNVSNISATAAVAAPTVTAGVNTVTEIAGRAGVGITPSTSAALDVSGGNDRGLRLRPRTTTGSPTTGTWNRGTMILDAAGNLHICTAAGTPGTWKKVGP